MDRTDKIILAALTAGIWANAAVMLLHPARASQDDLGAIASEVRGIESSLTDMARGTCSNHKLC